MTAVLNTLTPEQRAAAIKEAAILLEEQKANEKAERAKYKELASHETEELFAKMKISCDALKSVKADIFNSLQALIASKAEVFGVKEGQKTHSISTLDGRKRITVGYRDVSDWDGTETAGVEKIKIFIASLAKDENSSNLASGLTTLLKPDKKGQLDPRRIVELRNWAEEVNNPELTDGVNIIIQAYKMVKSKAILVFEERVNGSWRNIEFDLHDLPISLNEA